MATSNEGRADTGGIVREYFDLIMAGKYRDGLRFFAPDCVTHNPYVAGSIEKLTEAMIAAAGDMAGQAPNATFKVSHVLVDGELVAAHTELFNDASDPGQGGLCQVHLFRFKGGQGHRILGRYPANPAVPAQRRRGFLARGGRRRNPYGGPGKK